MCLWNVKIANDVQCIYLYSICIQILSYCSERTLDCKASFQRLVWSWTRQQLCPARLAANPAHLVLSWLLQTLDRAGLVPSPERVTPGSLGCALAKVSRAAGLCLLLPGGRRVLDTEASPGCPAPRANTGMSWETPSVPSSARRLFGHTCTQLVCLWKARGRIGAAPGTPWPCHSTAGWRWALRGELSWAGWRVQLHLGRSCGQMNCWRALWLVAQTTPLAELAAFLWMPFPIFLKFMTFHPMPNRFLRRRTGSH